MGGEERWGGCFSPILEQDVNGALCGVGLGRLRGPTLVEAKQEEVWRLRNLDLHVHLGIQFYHLNDGQNKTKKRSGSGKARKGGRTLLLSSMEGALWKASV